MDAKALPQEKIVEKIFESSNNGFSFKKGTIERFRNFLDKTLGIPEYLHNKVPLEGIFTP